MREPFVIAQTVLESYGIVRLFVKENSKLLSNSYGIKLKWVDKQIKNWFHSRYCISDNYDVLNI